MEQHSHIHCCWSDDDNNVHAGHMFQCVVHVVARNPYSHTKTCDNGALSFGYRTFRTTIFVTLIAIGIGVYSWPEDRIKYLADAVRYHRELLQSFRRDI